MEKRKGITNNDELQTVIWHTLLISEAVATLQTDGERGLI